MTIFIETTITEVGADVPDLLDGNLLIFYGLGAPPELAELSIVHAVQRGPTTDPPPVGATLTIGPVATALTAVGEDAWHGMSNTGHVVLNFNGAARPARPGEICAAPINGAGLAALLRKGTVITIEGA